MFGLFGDKELNAAKKKHLGEIWNSKGGRNSYEIFWVGRAKGGMKSIRVGYKKVGSEDGKFKNLEFFLADAEHSGWVAA